MPTEPSGEDRRRNQAIVNEILDITGNKVHDKPQDKSILKLKACNEHVARIVAKYYADHPQTTNVPDLRKLIWEAYAMEFQVYSRDDLHFLLSLEQTHAAMKHFGYGD